MAVITTGNNIDPFSTILASADQHQAYANVIAERYKGLQNSIGTISTSVMNTIRDSLEYVNSSEFINTVKRVTRLVGTQVDDNIIHVVNNVNLNNLTTRTRNTMMEEPTLMRLYQNGIYDEELMKGYVDPYTKNYI